MVVILLRHAVFGLVFGSIKPQDGVRVGIGYTMYSLLHTNLHLVWGVSEISRTGSISTYYRFEATLSILQEPSVK